MTAQTTPTLAAAVEQLARHRVLLADVNFEIESKRAEFEQSIADERTRCGLIKAFIAEDEAIVKEMGLKAYRATDSKRPHPAVEIKERRKASIPNLARAFAWAKEKMPLVILPESLDQKALMDFALKSKTPVPFVEITKEPNAQIATDLSQYLEAAPTA